MSVILVENLSKMYPVAVKEPGLKGTALHFFKRTYRQIKAVQNISFSIEPGEVVGFLGANGAGKTHHVKDAHGTHSSVVGACQCGGAYPISAQICFSAKKSRW